MRTRTTILLLTLGTFLLTSCSVNKKNDSTSSDSKIDKHADSVELTQLIRKIYTWNETKEFKPDFNYILKDSLLKGMDWTKNNERLEEIKKTDFFDDTFLDNLKDIAQLIDKYCKNDKEKYEFNLYPPWEDGVNDWCNCQGQPPGNWWETMTISDLKDSGDSANFNWTWGYKFYYRVTAIKKSDKWRVSYLQGFDKKNYTIQQ